MPLGISGKLLQPPFDDSGNASEPSGMFEKQFADMRELLEAGQEIVEYQSIRVAVEQRHFRKKSRHGDNKALRNGMTEMAMFENYNWLQWEG